MKSARAKLDVQVVRHERIDPARLARVAEILKRIVDNARNPNKDGRP